MKEKLPKPVKTETWKVVKWLPEKEIDALPSLEARSLRRYGSLEILESVKVRFRPRWVYSSFELKDWIARLVLEAHNAGRKSLIFL